MTHYGELFTFPALSHRVASGRIHHTFAWASPGGRRAGTLLTYRSADARVTRVVTGLSRPGVEEGLVLKALLTRRRLAAAAGIAVIVTIGAGGGPGVGA